jgi:PAS domain S-box-containing protein
VTTSDPDEDELLRSVTIQNARSILLARQKAEEELVAAKEALELRTRDLESANTLIRTIAENADSGLLMVDERGVATYMNPAAIDETGYTLEELATARFLDILHPTGDRAGHTTDECPIRRARERKLPLKRYRDMFVRKDGTVFPVSCSLSPLLGEGAAAGVVVEFRDITDEQVAQRALEETNRRKDQFLATLSHELRTPMTAVLGWVRMIKLGMSESETRDALEAIEKSASIQAQLIDDVLDVSRIVAGKMTFNPVPVDLGQALEGAIKTIRPAATAKGIEIIASVPGQLPGILGDEGRLQQIIWNVLSNAVKFTPRGGTITAGLESTGTILRLTVQDTGKGIEPAYLTHVFEAFSQEDGSTTRSHEGIGLGLSIARSLVELHGGTIRAQSDGFGLGATFTIEFPILEDTKAIEETSPGTADSLPPAPKSAIDQKLKDVRVLVIDDQQLTRDLLLAIFRRATATVSAASSVIDGLEQFRAETPDVVVCDIAMPGQDGFAFLEGVRSLESPANGTPLVALTAFGGPEDRERALSAGFDAYLRKPLDPEELTATIFRLVRKE